MLELHKNAFFSKKSRMFDKWLLNYMDRYFNNEIHEWHQTFTSDFKLTIFIEKLRDIDGPLV